MVERSKIKNRKFIKKNKKIKDNQYFNRTRRYNRSILIIKIKVCSEETINEILDRYKEINDHAESYTWKRLQRHLDMEHSLIDNDIPDETDEYINLEIDPDDYVPAIHLYFNDDLTEA